MIPVLVVPRPAGAPAGSVYFNCARLSATLSTQACASRWSTAASTSTCSGCPIGRQHHAATPSGAATASRARDRSRECLRCGRADGLRIIKQFGICVSCYNREREWHIGRNAKDKPPKHFEPLNNFAIATETAVGEIVHHAVEARHAAEAVGVVAMRLRSGLRLSTTRPGKTAWSAHLGRLVVACPACDHEGLLVRTMRGTLRHHCPACQGTPSGPDWALARPSAAVLVWPAATLVTWLQATGERPPVHWTTTAFGCGNCGAGALQARSTADSGLEARCPACHDHHEGPPR